MTADRKKLVLIGGAVRSGKSTFALKRARELGQHRIFLATAEARDSEMMERIDRHQAERGDEFQLIEEPLNVVARIQEVAATDASDRIDVVLIDCLTLWLSNMMLKEMSSDKILQEVERLLEVIQAAPFHVIAVTNEAGMGVVPNSSLGRLFRDLSGRTSQLFARQADEVYLGAMGMLIRLKPEPLTSVISLEDKK